MQIIGTLRKMTKQGLSVWNFCYNPETKVHFAVGGCDLKAIRADDREHLRQIYENFIGYGYATKLPTSKKMWISDPWSSDLPSELQHELEMLSA